MARKKPLLANDPLSTNTETGSVLDGILERNRGRSGRETPVLSSVQPPVVPPAVEAEVQPDELYTNLQPDNHTTPHVSLSGSKFVHNRSKAPKPETAEQSSGKNTEESPTAGQAIASGRGTVRERAQAWADSVKIPPKTLSVRITEEIDDRLAELAYRLKKDGATKQSLVIALLERGLNEFDDEEGPST